MGCSYSPLNIIAFRAGLHDGNLTIGTGLNLDKLRANIAWEKAPKPTLNDTYRFSIGMTL